MIIMAYDVAAIRKKIKESQQGKFNDPDEFKPAKATSPTEALKYHFFILPPVQAGDILNKSGQATRSQEQFFVPHGDHWVNNKPYPCPRMWDGSDCEICQFGFDLMKEDKCKVDKNYKTKVVQTWMPASYNMINIYFPNVSVNPEELRNRVLYYNAPKTIIDICMACLMRDDEGDPELPSAYGVFFDELKAFKFEMRVLKDGNNNSYKTSQFFPKPQPLAKNEDGTPKMAAIEAILKLRHDLFSKIEKPDRENIKKAFRSMVDGDDYKPNGGFDSGDAQTKTTSNKTSEKPADPVTTKPTNLNNETGVTESTTGSTTKLDSKNTKQPVDDDEAEIDAETRALMEQLASSND